MREDDMTSLGASMEEMFRRMGLPRPDVMARLSEEWDSIAPPPWPGRSKPLYIEDGTLVVEAGKPPMVAFLRYGTAALVETLAAHFGSGVIDRIDVRSPVTH
jgi:hypothetical protein